MPMSAAAGDVAESNPHPIRLAGPFADPCQAGPIRHRRSVADTSEIVGRSAALQAVLRQIDHVARTDAAVLLLGETGTGKELFASRLHTLSARCGRSMVRVNCGALPSTLIESELFGREKGAFTGGVRARHPIRLDPNSSGRAVASGSGGCRAREWQHFRPSSLP
jgi:Sigma-54 interaction domain